MWALNIFLNTRKLVFGAKRPVQLQRKDYKKLEILDLRSRKHKVADQLCSYCTADLRLCFYIGN